MRFVPTALARVVITQPQEQRFELLATAPLVAYCIGPRPAQVADRFIARLGHVHRSEFARPMRTSQFDGIAPVGLDPLARLAGNKRRGYHFACSPVALSAGK